MATLQADTTKTGHAHVNQVPVSVDVPESGFDTGAAQAHQFNVQVTGHNNTSATWSLSGCAANDCGTVSSTGLYTAPPLIPSATSVSVVATSIADPSKSDFVVVTLHPIEVQFPVNPWPEYDFDGLGAGASHQYNAIALYHPNTAVTWSVSGCAGSDCGSINPEGLYTAPSIIPSDTTVNVIATSVADPTKSASSILPLKAVSVSLSPLTSVAVAVDASTAFKATVQNDGFNAGVTFAFGGSCSEGNCGTLTDVTPGSVTYKAPSTVPMPAIVTLTATSVTDPSKTAQATVTVSSSPLLKEGDYAFLFDGWRIDVDTFSYYSAHRVAIAGHFHVDSNGNLSEGIQDINDPFQSIQPQPFSGTYAIGPDGRGVLMIVSDAGTSTWHVTIEPSADKGTFIKLDAKVFEYYGGSSYTGVTGSGSFERQENTAFSLAALQGSYAIGVYGSIQESVHLAGVGGFTADSTGTLIGGAMDVRNSTTTFENLALSGSLAAASTTGRGTATIMLNPAPDGTSGVFDFVYYVVSDKKIFLVQTDARASNVPVLSGIARRQSGTFSNTSLNMPVIFSSGGSAMLGYGANSTSAIVGRMSAGTSGTMTGVFDQNEATALTLNQAFAGSYAIEANGRCRMTLNFGGTPLTQICYLVSDNEGFLIQTTGPYAPFGYLKPQTGGPFAAASLSGSYVTNAAPPANENAENDSGLTSFNGANTVDSTLDYSYFTQINEGSYTGTYNLSNNGRVTMTLNQTKPLVLWIISPNEVVGIATIDVGNYIPVLMEYRK